jgi:UDP-3-O-[3-hydroxymyristoyl] glucosamine N-acyltransferase
MIKDTARIGGFAMIYGDASIEQNAVASYNCKIFDDAVIRG